MTTAIPPIMPVAGLPGAELNGTAAAVQAPDFSAWLERKLAAVDNDVAASNRAVESLALGQSEGPHEVMLALEKARDSVALMVQVRNRVVEAYQDLMRMEI